MTTDHKCETCEGTGEIHREGRNDAPEIDYDCGVCDGTGRANAGGGPLAATGGGGAAPGKQTSSLPFHRQGESRRVETIAGKRIGNETMYEESFDEPTTKQEFIEFVKIERKWYGHHPAGYGGAAKIHGRYVPDNSDVVSKDWEWWRYNSCG